MPKIDEKAKKLLEGKNFVFVATLNADGSPHLTPTWVDTDGQNVLVNTALGRKKMRNIARDPRVAVSLYDQDNPYDYVTVEGRVAKKITGKKAEDHIDKLAFKYTGSKKYKGRTPTQKRVILVIKPSKIYHF